MMTATPGFRLPTGDVVAPGEDTLVARYLLPGGIELRHGEWMRVASKLSGATFKVQWMGRVTADAIGPLLVYPRETIGKGRLGVGFARPETVTALTKSGRAKRPRS